MRSPVYLLFGLALLAAAGYADLRGLFASPTQRNTNVPRSIRQNPGAYRSLYNGSPRVFGGK
ncbi:MAG: hypothetical protein U0Q55_20460 [Vicinamibacterales bacterium]